MNGIERKPLWPHQQSAIGLLRASLRTGHKRPLLYSPTGSGKTTIASEITLMAREKDSRVAFTVPAISIVDQTLRSFWKAGLRDVGVIQADHVQTDWSKPIQLCSLDTLWSRDAYPKVKVVIVDEAHITHKALTKWMEMCPDVVFIGLSATPFTKGLGKVYDDFIHAASITDLIKAGILAPHRTFAPSHPDLEGVKTTAGDFNGAQLAKKANQKALTGDVVQTWLDHAERRPTFCFAVDCAHAQLLHEQFRDAGVSAAYVDHNVSLLERAQIERDFEKGNVEVICNVDCMGLGVDLPMTSCISYARPTKSLTRWMQNIGRGLRSYEGKTDCLILDHSDTTLRLGFVDEIVVDGLDDGTQRKARDYVDRERLPKPCVQCGYVRLPEQRECPNCGYIPAPQTSARVVDGKLVEVDVEEVKSLREKRKRDMKFTEEEKLTVFRMFVGYARKRGYREGWAKNKYREFFKVWPNGFGYPAPLEPSPEIADWIKGSQIRWIKGKQKGASA